MSRFQEFLPLKVFLKPQNQRPYISCIVVKESEEKRKEKRIQENKIKKSIPVVYVGGFMLILFTL